MRRSAPQSLLSGLVTLGLVTGVVGSALALVNAKHEARQLFVELERLNGERDRLQVEWGQLQLEQSTWATHARMESLGRGELALVTPAPSDIILLSERP